MLHGSEMIVRCCDGLKGHALRFHFGTVRLLGQEEHISALLPESARHGQKGMQVTQAAQCGNDDFQVPGPPKH